MEKIELKNLPAGVIALAPEGKLDTLRAFYAMRPGAFYRVSWLRPMATRKTAGPIRLEKFGSAVIRSGVDYDNQATVVAKRESGELPMANAGLPWGEWADFPRTIKHKGGLYLRFSTVPGQTATRVFLLDGKPIDETTAKTLALASEFSDRDALDCFTLKLDTLQGLEIVN